MKKFYYIAWLIAISLAYGCGAPVTDIDLEATIDARVGQAVSTALAPTPDPNKITAEQAYPDIFKNATKIDKFSIEDIKNCAVVSEYEARIGDVISVEIAYATKNRGSEGTSPQLYVDMDRTEARDQGLKRDRIQIEISEGVVLLSSNDDGSSRDPNFYVQSGDPKSLSEYREKQSTLRNVWREKFEDSWEVEEFENVVVVREKIFAGQWDGRDINKENDPLHKVLRNTEVGQRTDDTRERLIPGTYRVSYFPVRNSPAWSKGTSPASSAWYIREQEDYFLWKLLGVDTGMTDDRVKDIEWEEEEKVFWKEEGFRDSNAIKSCRILRANGGMGLNEKDIVPDSLVIAWYVENKTGGKTIQDNESNVGNATKIEFNVESGNGASSSTIATSTRARNSSTTLVIASGTTAKYSVGERLARFDTPITAEGTTQQVVGALEFDSNGKLLNRSSITIDATTFKSDENKRDRWIKRNGGLGQKITFGPTELLDISWPLPTYGSSAFVIVGDMTISDTTVSTEWDTIADFSGDQITGTAKTSINWDQFNLSKPRLPFIISVDDDIFIELNFKATR